MARSPREFECFHLKLQSFSFAHALNGVLETPFCISFSHVNVWLQVGAKKSTSRKVSL
jgi:hypothetical protein